MEWATEWWLTNSPGLRTRKTVRGMILLVMIWRDDYEWLRAVVPQFGIANLVQISPIPLGFIGGYIYSIHGDYKPTNITRGYHLVCFFTCFSISMGQWLIFNHRLWWWTDRRWANLCKDPFQRASEGLRTSDGDGFGWIRMDQLTRPGLGDLHDTLW